MRRSIALAVCAILLIALGGIAHGVGGASAATAPTLLSQGKKATASGYHSAAYAPALAVDGKAATHWWTAAKTNQWLQVDLGAQKTLTSITIRWEGAWAKRYSVQSSPDAKTWTTLMSTGLGKGGTVVKPLTGTGRYVRVFAATGGTTKGFSITEMQVYGTAAPTPTPPPTPTPTPTATGVHVTGTQGAWQLTVDGQPYVVKGVTYDPGVMDPATYLPDVHSMGANTVRDWGTDTSAATDSFFAQAQKNDIRVIAGFWLDTGQDWTTNTAYQNQQLQTIEATVAKYKDSDAVLMWDVGNEVMLNLPSDAQRIAYARYVEKVTEAIHAIDPDHPVTSTDAQDFYWPIYAQYAPSLDLYALNTYQGISGVDYYWHHYGSDSDGTFTKPYILTETGPLGWWGETPTDANGQPMQESDAATAQHYVDAWNDIVGDSGVALGGTMFHYTTETDLQATWFSLLPGGLKRASYYALAKAWGGTPGSNRPPVVSSVTIPASVSAGSTFTISAPATDPDGDAMTWTVKDTASTLSSNGTAQTVVSGSTSTLTVTAPATPGVWRYYEYVTDGHGNADIESQTVKVVAAG